MLSTTSMILTDVTNHYNKLVDEHRKLDTEIKSSEETYVLDIDVKKLKKRKLHLKDEIEVLKNATVIIDDINENPVNIKNPSEFLENLIATYSKAKNSHYIGYAKIKKARSVKKLVNFE